MDIKISGIEYDNHIGWCFNVVANKKVNINGKEIEMVLKEQAINKWLCDYEVVVDEKIELNAEEFEQLKKEKEKFVAEVNQILNLKK